MSLYTWMLMKLSATHNLTTESKIDLAVILRQSLNPKGVEDMTTTFGVHTVKPADDVKISSSKNCFWIEFDSLDYEVTLFFLNEKEREEWMLKVCEAFMRKLGIRRIEAPSLDMNDSNPY